MPNYRATYWYRFSVDYEVEAQDPDAARKAAELAMDKDSDADMIEHSSDLECIYEDTTLELLEEAVP